MSVDSPDVAAGKRLIDQAKALGFRFSRTAPGEDVPLLGIRETLEWVDEMVLTGFWAEGCCYASRRGRCSLLVPGGTPLIAEVSGDALTVLHTVVTDWGSSDGR